MCDTCFLRRNKRMLDLIVERTPTELEIKFEKSIDKHHSGTDFSYFHPDDKVELRHTAQFILDWCLSNYMCRWLKLGFTIDLPLD